jgi:Ankyrin repeats (many copies)
MCRFVLISSLLVLSSASAHEGPAVPPSLPGDPLPKITDGYEEVVGGYERALIAAAHHFAGAGELDHLGALLAKHPGFVDAKLKFAGPRKPVSGDGFSLLHRASANGRVDVVKFLIDKRAKLEADDGYGWTPLHLAAKGGNLHVVKLLVEAGANVRAGTTARPSSQRPGGRLNAPPEYSSPIPAYTPLEIAGTATDLGVQMKRDADDAEQGRMKRIRKKLFSLRSS